MVSKIDQAMREEVRESERGNKERGAREGTRRGRKTKKSRGQREPIQHMAKMAESYRDQKLGERKQNWGLERFRVGSRGGLECGEEPGLCNRYLRFGKRLTARLL